MPTWFRLANNVAVELTDADPAGRFHEDIVWVIGAADTQLGDVYNGSTWSHPAAAPTLPTSRIISSDAFRELFTPAQQAALWLADPRLMAGMLKVITQGTANLDSPECSGLLSLAVAKGGLTEAEKARILSNTPPPADPPATP